MRTGTRADLHDEFRGSLEEALERCRALHAKDKAAEGATKVATVGVLLFLPATLGTFFWLIDAFNEGYLAWSHGVAFLVSLLGFGLSAFGAWRAAKGDFEDRRLAVVRGLLERLGPELRPGSPIGWHLEFRPYDLKAADRDGRQVFAQQWLSLDFVLLDGSEVRCEVGIHVKQKRRRKPKHTKIKERFYERLIVRIRPPKGTSLGPIPAGGGELAKGRLRLHRSRVRPRGADLEWRTDEASRMFSRAGWQGDSGAGEISPRRLLLGVIGSHKLVATGQRSQAAS